MGGREEGRIVKGEGGYLKVSEADRERKKEVG